MNNSTKNNCKLGAIFGNGRSGTTWLGAIISSHPDVSYRFEPFHRLQSTNTRINKANDIILSDNFSVEDLPYIYKALSPAYPECEKPPFFAKNFSIKPGRKFVWPLSRNNPVGAYLFQNIYTPEEQPILIFKEVACVEILMQLIKLAVPIVYIIRHPCAVVSSVMRGQKNLLMPSKRRSVLESLLAKYQPTLAEKYQHKLDSLDICEQEALLWLIDAERSLNACQNNSHSLVVVYEQLTQEPLPIAEKVFQHFGLQMAEESVFFIQESIKNSSTSRLKRGEIGIDSYFTVFRDPDVSRDRWKQEMSQEDQKKVMKIVEHSNAFAIYTQ